MDKIKNDLLELKDDDGYKEFIDNLIVNERKTEVLGVRMGALRKYGKELVKDKELSSSFIKDLPHQYLEEYHIHGIILSNIKDYDLLIKEINILLPYLDNWSVVDSFNPKLLGKFKEETLTHIKKWINSGHTYTIRFGIITLMRNYLSNDIFSSEILDLVKNINFNEYYVNMARAWFFAEALIKQYDRTIKYIEDKSLDKFTHNKTILKARDSYRVSEEKKEYLKTLRM